MSGEIMAHLGGGIKGTFTPDDVPDLSRTAKAIETRDRVMPLLDEKLACESNAVALKVLAEIEAVERDVGAAFGEDTKDRNDPKVCADCVRAGPPVPPPGCELSFVRRMVNLWRERSKR